MKQSVYVIGVLCCLFNGMAHAQHEGVHKGDIIDIQGEKAMVFHVDEEGHGSAVNINAFRGHKSPWCKDKKIVNRVQTVSEADGMANTQAVYEFCTSQGVSLSQFPVFEWCKSLGEGWYIPSAQQMEALVNFWLGNEQEYDWSDDENDTTEELSKQELDERIMKAGGTPFISGMYTSTKSIDGGISVIGFDMITHASLFIVVPNSRIGGNNTGRAFYDF